MNGAGLDVAAIRADFPILAATIHGDAALAYLDNAASTQRPRAVLDAMRDFYETDYANVHRGIHWLSERATERYEAARHRVARFLGAASADEIVFTRGTTEAINLVARSYGDAFLSAGDEVLVTELEHHANLVPWQQLAERRGVVVRFAKIDDQGRLDLESFRSLLSPRTKLVAVAAVSNVLGSRLPVRLLADAAHAAGAKLVVDAAQSAPHEPLDVAEWDADFVAFSGHKLLGPTGVGALWARREILESMPPFQGGGGMIRRVRASGFEAAEPPARFEAGTPAIAEAIGLAAALDYLDAIGLERIAAHERRLATRAHEKLSGLRGVRIYGPTPADKAGIVSFTVEGVHAHDVAQIADRHGVALRAGHHCAMPLHERLGVPATARASFYLYNTEEEVDRLAESVADAQKRLRRA